MSTNKNPYVVDIDKLNRYESIAYQQAFKRVKKDIRVFEAELRDKIAQEIYDQEYDRLKAKWEKEIRVRVEKQVKHEYEQRFAELERLIQDNQAEKAELKSHREWQASKRENMRLDFSICKAQLQAAIEYKQSHPSVTIRQLHQKFYKEIALSTFHKYFKLALKTREFV